MKEICSLRATFSFKLCLYLKASPMRISIPEPCSEDWSKMTPTEQGAFCQKCALEVTDFTDKTSLEIKSILTSKFESKQRVCGHIENRQLVQLNDDFIPWKSDQESFRAVWMFSLIAVFGLTLFSCQSTFSKEVVEKMNTSTELLMEEEKDTLDLAKLNDSIHLMNVNDSLLPFIGDPWIHHPQVFVGIPISYGGFGVTEVIDWGKVICYPAFMGSMTLRGDIIENDPDIEENDNQLSFLKHLEPRIPSPPAQSPRVHDQNQNSSQRLYAKMERGRPEFAAYISPLPIEKSSKLFVTMPDEGMLKLSVWEFPSLSKLHSESFDLVFGNHSVQINFEAIPKGKYAIQLTFEEEKIVLPFEVFEKTTA